MSQLTVPLSDFGQRPSSVLETLVSPAANRGDAMTTPQEPGFTPVAELPPYRSLLVVDMKDYSGATGRQQAHLNAVMPDILESAFVRCGLEAVWHETTFADSTGDGYAIGLPAKRLPFLLNPYLEALQNELADRSSSLSAAGFQPIRMRVSVTVGPVTDSGRGLVSDGAGTTRVELHRLLDSEPVRDLLKRSGEATRVAAIVSSRAFEDAVVGGYTDEDPDLYVEAPVTVKKYQGLAYLRVPLPSGDLLRSGFRRAEDDSNAAPHESKLADRPPRQAASVQANDHSHNRRGGIGNITGNVHSIVTDPTGPTHTGTGHQYFGSGSHSPEQR
ncbi:hypothetical protein ACQPXM_27205 [Kribbella sp. CA-253562]|uniref:hypothetical protein n=1 Tax=Kribbella sp. CA-253562 TaxID=3239942 RepID=UPI003D89B54C